MNRFLLPTGLVLAALVAFDSVFEHRLRLAELQRAEVCTPQQLIALRTRLTEERAAWIQDLESRLSSDRELETERDDSARDEIARLEAALLQQRELLEQERERSSDWEARWSELTPTVLQRRLFELQSSLESQVAEFDLFTKYDEDKLQRVHREMRALDTKLELSLAARDNDKLWADLVGPVVQLIGDTTVGSGVLLESRSQIGGGFATHVLTSWHVVRDIIGRPDNTNFPVPVKVYAPDGTWRSLTAQLLVRDVSLDLALLLLDTSDALPFGARLAPRSELETLRTFDAVYAVGCPLGNDPIPTVGELASTHHEVDGEKYWMISAPTYIGNSGGGIYSARSHGLVGVFSKIYTHGATRSIIVPHMGLATPLTVVYDWLGTTEYAYLEPRLPEAGAQTAAATR